MPPSAMTVCALPSSDLQMRATLAHALGGRDGGPEPRAAGADHEDVVVEPPMTHANLRLAGRYRILQSVQMPIEQRRT